jgi:hypothetical protein
MKIISGGQTGVDRAALDSAMHVGMSHGGWCPAGRKAEDGIIHEKYELSETEINQYVVRTELNVLDSDATLICVWNNVLGKGTKKTLEYCQKHQKPCFICEINDENATSHILKWIRRDQIHVLNVAGNRESESSGIYLKCRKILDYVFFQIIQ